MALADPPPVATLAQLPVVPLAGRRLHRVFRASRSSPWWFASLPAGEYDPDAHGRFDLPAPGLACYLACSAVAAVLEIVVGFDRLADVDLRARRRAEVVAPPTAPPAADVTARQGRGYGVTATLRAGGPRRMTQRWAAALRRAGWRAVYSGVAGDPAGDERAVALFDDAGEHAPYDDDGWAVSVHTLHDDAGLHEELARFGVTVTRSDPQLPVVGLKDSGLL